MKYDNTCKYIVVKDTPNYVIIKDIGPWNKYKTITNDADGLVLFLSRELGKRRLFYFDSEGELAELLHDGQGTFKGFAPIMDKVFKKELEKYK